MSNIKTNHLDNIKDYNFKDFSFSSETLTCKRCKNIYNRVGFDTTTLKAAIKEYLVQQSKSDVRYLRNSTSENTSPVKITCKSCIIKFGDQFKCEICQDTYLVEKFCIEQTDKNSKAICRNCADNSLESKINSTENHLLQTNDSTFFNSATSNKLTESIERGLVSDFDQSYDDTALLKNPTIDELQLKVKRQIQPQLSKSLNIPKLNTSIYSLLQLSGRKNPPTSNPKEYETKNSSSINIRKKIKLSHNSILENNSPPYKQKNAQNSTEISSEIKDYVLQFVDSIYSYSNGQKNESDLLY